jgi:hypothetical protein
MHLGYWWESQKEGDHWEDVGGWTIFKWILREIGWDGVDWMDMAQEGSCEHGFEPSGSFICWDVVEGLHTWGLLKMGSAP